MDPGNFIKMLQLNHGRVLRGETRGGEAPRGAPAQASNGEMAEAVAGVRGKVMNPSRPWLSRSQRGWCARALLLWMLIGPASTPWLPCAEPGTAPPATTVSFASLLLEMVDRDALARFPALDYRQMQASSYSRKSTRRDQPEQDTRGWFADSDGVSWIRDETIDGKREAVIMEHEGPGCITRIWTPFFYYGFHNRVGPRIKIYLDGSDTPVIDEHFIELLTRNDWPASYGHKPPRQNSFQVPSPFADFTARAGDSYLPIPFARSCKVTLTDKAFYHSVNYRAYPEGTPVKSFTRDQYRLAQALLKKVGNELEKPSAFAGKELLVWEGEVPAGTTRTIRLKPGSAAVRYLEVQCDPGQVRDDPSLLRSTLLQATFDEDDCIWCPLGDFYGSANALNPMHTYARTVTAEGRMICRWVMPYKSRGAISLRNLGRRSVRLKLSAGTSPWQWGEDSLHFFARWRGDDVLQGNRFVDWNFVDIRGKGVLVGDQWTVLNLTRGWWGEGDEKIYVDDAYSRTKFPDHFGTGTEDYYGWAGGVNPTREDCFSHPFLANISVGSTKENNTRGFNICTRLRGLDAVPFTRRLVFDMEASPGVQQRNAWNLLGYSAVTFFYARPGASSNRPPRPDAAARPIMSIESLQRRSAELAAAGIRRVKGAIEFENLTAVSRSPGLEVHAQVPSPFHRPEVLSGRAHMFIPFRKVGEYVEFRITERFRAEAYTLHVSKCYDYGVVRIAVNGRVVRENLDLYSKNLAVQAVDLGVIRPIDNAISIRLELVAPSPRSRGSKTFAGVDYLLPKAAR